MPPGTVELGGRTTGLLGSSHSSHPEHYLSRVHLEGSGGCLFIEFGVEDNYLWHYCFLDEMI